VIASVTGWPQDEHLALTGSFHMGVGIGVAAFDLAESGAGTLLQFSFRAIGVVDAGEGVPFPTVESGAEPAPDGPATFPTGWFISRDRAYQWLAE
jgi:hypothetical protein